MQYHGTMSQETKNTNASAAMTAHEQVTDFESGCDLAYEAGRPMIIFVTEQQALYKFFPSRIYENYPKVKTIRNSRITAQTQYLS